MTTKTGRNDPCPCGSGKKFKQCCQQRNASHPPPKPSADQVAVGIRAGLLHQQAGRPAQAEAIYKKILQIVPNNPDALHLLGTTALQSGKVDESVRLISKAIKFNSSNPEYYSNLGFAFHEQGDLDSAEKNYHKALSIKPGYANALYNLHALLLNAKNISSAVVCLRKIVDATPSDIDARFMLSVLLDYCGDTVAALSGFNIIANSTNLYRARLDAWKYLKAAGSRIPEITGSMIQTFKLAFDAAPKNGLVLEFGVRFGNTIRQIAAIANQQVHGFDSFEGLPEDWHDEIRGSYTTQGHIPLVPKNVTLHAGWFEDTLPTFLQQHQGSIRLINVDCDIYSSTKTILDQLASRIVPGSVIIFDEYIGNEHWREDEFKAFQEAVVRYNWTYEYLCFSVFTKQVAVRIKTILRTP